MLKKIKQELKAGRVLLQFGFLRALGQGLGMIAPLVIAKFFTEGLFGSYCLAKMIIFFFASLLVASSQTPFIVYANQERAQTGRISKSFSVQFGFLAFSIIVFVLFSLAFSRRIQIFAEVSSADVLFMSMGFVGIAAKSFLCNLFMALGQRMKNALVELVFGLLTLGIVLVLILTGNINIKTVFLTYLLSAAVVLLIFIRSVDFKQLLPFEFEREHFRDMFNFTKWVMFGATAVYFINWVDNIVLRAFKVSVADIGEYGLAYQIFKGVVMLTYILNGYFLPFISEHINNSDKMRAYLYSKRPKIFLLGLAAIIVLFVAVPYAFGFVYKDAYQGSVGVLSILLFGNVIILYNTFYIPILNALKKYKFAQATNVAHIIIKVVLSVLLIPPFGLKGAAIATVASYFFKAVIIEVYFRMRLKKSLGL